MFVKAILLFSLMVYASAQVCDENGCDLLTIADLRPQFAVWGEVGADCNADGRMNVLDYVCMLNQVPNLDAPQFDLVGPQHVTVGEVLTFTVVAVDPNDDLLVFGVEDLPRNATFDVDSGVFRFEPDEDQSGIFVVVFTVYDGFLRRSMSVTVTVRRDCVADPSRVSTSPAHGEREVAATRETILRFTRPLSARVYDQTSVVAEFAGAALPATYRLSSDRRTLTLFYDEPLPASARIRLTLFGDQLMDEDGCAVDVDGDGLQGGVATIDFDTLTLTVIDHTAVCGRVFNSNLVTARGGDAWVNEPLEGVVVKVDGLEDTHFAVTDALGNFRLEPAPAGRFFVHIDGRAVADVPAGAYFPNVGKTWTSTAGQEVNVGDVYLPLIADGTLQSVSDEQDTVITFPDAVVADRPEFADVSIRVPAGALYADDGTAGGMVGLAPVEPERLPGTLPEGLDFPLVITVQTDGATNFDTPAPICFPNLPDPDSGRISPPGEKSALWSFNHDAGRWEVVGSMTVGADGLLVCSDPGVGIRAPGWHGEGPGVPGGDGSPDGPEQPQDPKKPMTPAPAAPGKAKGPPQDPDNPSDPIYLFSGEFYEPVEDLRIKGRGMDFIWSRTYRSRWGLNTAQGNGWDFSYNVFLQASGRLLRACEGNGRVDDFHPDPSRSETWTRNEFFSELSRDGETYVMTYPDGGVWRYHGFAHPAAGKLFSIEDRNGNRIRLHYDDQGRLARIVDTLDREVEISYNAEGFISAVTDFTGRSVTYTYYDGTTPDGNFGDLATVTSQIVVGTPNGNDFPDGKTTTYTYSKGFEDPRLNGNLLTITDPKGQTYLTNVYADTTDPERFEFDRVLRQVWGDPGDIIDLVYLPQEPSAENGGAFSKTIINDRMGNVSEFNFDLGNRVTVHRSYTGRADPDQPTTETQNRPSGKLRIDDPDFFETRNEWTSDALPRRITHPDGAVTEYVYQADLNPATPSRSRGNLKIVRRLPGPNPHAEGLAVIEEFFEYDTETDPTGFNLVTKHTNGRGHVTVYVYDARGNRLSRTHPITRIVETFEYNDFGQRTAHVHPDNGAGHRRRDEMTYYEIGPMRGYLHQAIVDAGHLALTSTFEYDAVGNRTRIATPGGHDSFFVYNALDQIVRERSREVIEGSGIRFNTDYAYDLNDNLIQRDVQNRDADGVLQANTHLTHRFSYEILNYLSAEIREVDDDHDVQMTYEYDANRNRTLERKGAAVSGDQIENVVSMSYDERDLLFQRTRAPGHPNQSTTQIDYDAGGQIKRQKVGLEDGPLVTHYRYDGYGRPYDKIDPMGNREVYAYDAGGNRVSFRVEGELIDVPGGEANVRLWDELLVYDEMNRLIRTESVFFDPESQTDLDDGLKVTRYAYSDSSQRTLVTDDNGHRTHYLYDGSDRLQVVTDAMGNTRTFNYDDDGQVKSIVEVEISDLGAPDESFTTSYDWDPLGRLMAITDNVGNVFQFGYDTRDNRVLETDALGNVTRHTFDGLNRLTQTALALTDDGTGLGSSIGEIVLTQEWDDSSRLTARQDGGGAITTYVYDPLDRRTAEIFADGTVKTSSFNIYDDLVEITNPNADVVRIDYDLAGRKRQKTITPGPGVSDDTGFEIYQYDGMGRLVLFEDDDTQVRRDYDANGQITRESQNGRIIASTFDAVGNRLTSTYPSGRQLAYGYDGLNRLKTVMDGSEIVAAYAYVGPERLTRRDLGNGTRMDRVYNGIAGTPNQAGDFGVRQVVGLTHRDGDDGVFDQWSFAWDALGNKVLSWDRLADSMQTHHYDSAYRMVRSDHLGGSVETTFDDAQNRRLVIGGLQPGEYRLENADALLNQYTTTPFDRRSYDFNGNLIRINEGEADERRFSYDYKNRLVTFEDLGASLTALYGYDALDRRVSRTLIADATTTTFYRYLDWHVVEEYERDDLTVSFVYGQATDDLISMRRQGRHYYFHSDDLGSVIKVTDAQKALVEQYAYDDYGRPMIKTGAGLDVDQSQIGNPLLYTARRFDPESALYYVRSRYLDPSMGRFITRDPIGVWGDEANLGNGFAYVANNPRSFVDPFGQRRAPPGLEEGLGLIFGVPPVYLPNLCASDPSYFDEHWKDCGEMGICGPKNANRTLRRACQCLND